MMCRHQASFTCRRRLGLLVPTVAIMPQLGVVYRVTPRPSAFTCSARAGTREWPDGHALVELGTGMYRGRKRSWNSLIQEAPHPVRRRSDQKLRRRATGSHAGVEPGALAEAMAAVALWVCPKECPHLKFEDPLEPYWIDSVRDPATATLKDRDPDKGYMGRCSCDWDVRVEGVTDEHGPESDGHRDWRRRSRAEAQELRSTTRNLWTRRDLRRGEWQAHGSGDLAGQSGGGGQRPHGCDGGHPQDRVHQTELSESDEHPVDRAGVVTSPRVENGHGRGGRVSVGHPRHVREVMPGPVWRDRHVGFPKPLRYPGSNSAMCRARRFAREGRVSKMSSDDDHRVHWHPENPLLL